MKIGDVFILVHRGSKKPIESDEGISLTCTLRKLNRGADEILVDGFLTVIDVPTYPKSDAITYLHSSGSTYTILIDDLEVTVSSSLSDMFLEVQPVTGLDA